MRVLATAVVWLLAAAPAIGEEQPASAKPLIVRPSGAKCSVKEVFNRFCLCGPWSETPKPDLILSPHARVYNESDGGVLLSRSTDGRVGMVLRTYSTETWLEFMSLSRRVEAIYGEPAADDSYFPDYADDNDSRETSIRVGSGRIRRQWLQPGFEVWLIFERDLLGLRYDCAGTTLEGKSEQL
jgi:hypothetical protein